MKEREQLLSNAPFVSVVIPTHDRPEALAACLNSLLSLRYPHYEIIVVDNAPGTDATARLVQSFSQESALIRYVREDRPGPSCARNRGIAIARGEILAFADDDVIVDPYWLIGLVEGFGSAKDVACVTGLVLPLELETPAQFLFEEYGGFNRGFTLRVFDRACRPVDAPFYPLSVGCLGVGASMAFSAAFLKRLGGFDPVLGAGSGMQSVDLAIFFQVIMRGHTLVYQPSALLYHLHRRRYAELRRQIYNYGAGFTAFLMNSLLQHPLLLSALLANLPQALFRGSHTRSFKTQQTGKNLPEDLVLQERKGLLYGPLAFLRRQWSTRKLMRKFARYEMDEEISLRRDG